MYITISLFDAAMRATDSESVLNLFGYDCRASSQMVVMRIFLLPRIFICIFLLETRLLASSATETKKGNKAKR